ncbi:MAG: class I SAM-dependent methyltransferase, partial [Xanthomonadales bacterium]
MALRRAGSMAATADRHYLYQEAVQDPEAEIDFIEETWQNLRDRPAELLREDFCGTALTACEWVRRDSLRWAVGIDLDAAVLEWGRENNLAQLDDDARTRITLRCADVLEVEPEAADIVLAMNFSYFLFRQRAELRAYFESVHAALVEDGLFFLDAYGGYEAPMVLQEERDCDGFTYVWDQAAFNPIDSRM